ncbi:serine/threonine protein kinase [Halomonas sp. KO116]|uniref:serine/threonine protein kinase n=1 Tax=Halomonas sp. KO116 TaxID=1504981 RepID=UPI0004E32388|nr:serine/threonine protein kinase [Halomonas sp. KO116]AJY50066.1 Glycine amidinotransferase [Halomonas sp. KO116]
MKTGIIDSDAEKIKVNSWNEWDPLKRVMVGRAKGTMVQAPEPAVIRDWPNEGFPKGSYGLVPDELVDAADEQLDNLVKILEKKGVKVDRPSDFDFAQEVSTPDWNQKSMFGCMPPRDVLAVVGNEILEATMSQRSRWHEYLCYRPLIINYFKNDSKMKWEAAPKPRLSDESFNKNFWEKYEKLSNEEKLIKVRENDLILTDEEPLFDAADISRLGKDLFVQLSLVTNKLGYKWIKNHFKDHRVHAVTFDNYYPQHIDATFVPLKPGMVLHCGERTADPELIRYFEKNDWQIIKAEKPSKTYKTLPRMSFCSPWLSMNLLSIDQNTIVVEESEKMQIEQLDKLGFNVVPVPFWDVAPFGGGLHCATVDIEREGEMEDYFPNRHGRF